ncbi:secreted RxLR effector protein 161-like [Elaeis guineensis]|uniref:secreted RxLR effector protein 161-like n=1 Tax=Elaeis guineensis var. tenera TaxID=51953 RepID=UPI003C6CF813
MSSQTEMEAQKIERVPYASGVGIFMYVMEALTSTEGDFRYLVDTVGVGICYGQRGGAEGLSNMPKEARGLIGGFVDADFGGDVDTRRSMTDFVFSLFGGPVSWRSYLQPITVLSTTEAEYIGIMEAVKEALWLKDLVLEMGFAQEAVWMHCTNACS